MFAIYTTQEAAQVAVDECNAAYFPNIQDPITQCWADVEQFAEGWGFMLPPQSVWQAGPDAALIEQPTPEFL